MLKETVEKVKTLELALQKMEEKAEKRYDTIQNHNNKTSEKIEDIRSFSN